MSLLQFGVCSSVLDRSFFSRRFSYVSRCHRVGRDDIYIRQRVCSFTFLCRVFCGSKRGGCENVSRGTVVSLPFFFGASLRRLDCYIVWAAAVDWRCRRGRSLVTYMCWVILHGVYFAYCSDVEFIAEFESMGKPNKFFRGGGYGESDIGVGACDRGRLHPTCILTRLTNDSPSPPPPPLVLSLYFSLCVTRWHYE